MTRFYGFILNVTACCILTMTPALADEAQDIALAESLISEIKRHIKADKRAFERATDALSKTEEGKSRMATCRSRNTSFWRLCMAKDWKFDGAYEPLYEQFYDEEMAAIVAEELEATQDGNGDQ